MLQELSVCARDLLSSCLLRRGRRRTRPQGFPCLGHKFVCAIRQKTVKPRSVAACSGHACVDGVQDTFGIFVGTWVDVSIAMSLSHSPSCLVSSAKATLKPPSKRESAVSAKEALWTTHHVDSREHGRAFFRSHASWNAARGSEYRVDPPITVLAHPGHAQSATWKSTSRLTYGLAQDLRLDLRVRPLQ